PFTRGDRLLRATTDRYHHHGVIETFRSLVTRTISNKFPVGRPCHIPRHPWPLLCGDNSFACPIQVHAYKVVFLCLWISADDQQLPIIRRRDKAANVRYQFSWCSADCWNSIAIAKEILRVIVWI